MKVKFHIRVYTNPGGRNAPYKDQEFVDVDHIGTVVGKRRVHEDYWTRFDYEVEYQSEDGKTLYRWVPDYNTVKVDEANV
jgi:hypothetical protein